ncbi:hypothetical protein ABIA16_003851 [Sinorhizobium fredii]
MRVEDVNEEMIDAGMVVLTEFLEWENYPYEDRDLIGAIIRAAVKAYVPKPPPAKRRVRGADQAGFVYFIKSGNYIKIGKAKDVRSRMSGIQTGAPERLECLGIIAGGLRKERELHKLFAEHRANGEWFNDCREIREFIKDKCAPMNDNQPKRQDLYKSCTA